MDNTIKFLNMEFLFEKLLNLRQGESESVINQKCIKLGNNQDFKKLFFFCDEKETDYFYQEKNESRIKEFIQNNLDENIINNEYIFDTYINYLEEVNDGNTIDFEMDLGGFYINNGCFYNYLSGFLEDEENINKLVNAKNFYDELEIIKADCLKACIDDLMKDLQQQIKDFELSK